MKVIAIIPARSGSKGLPNKNIIDLNGMPLMSYTINAALKSGCFDEIMVSTDSQEYANIAKAYGASVPFLRSNEMSGDSASSWDTVREVLQNYEKLGQLFDYICLLQPTSPLRDEVDIKNVFSRLVETNSNNAITITEVEHPVQWCFKLGKNDSMNEMAASPYSYMRRQDLDTYYRENGAIYLIDAKKFIDENYNYYADNCVGCVMDKDKSIDIDSAIDLEFAKIIMSKRNTHNI